MPPKEQPASEELLTSYLLGALPPQEEELLDERSIADEEFYLRLDAVENDLVDSYVRGELASETLERFKVGYLSSPSRVQKVEFARALVQLERRRSAGATTEERTAASAIPKPNDRKPKTPRTARWIQVGGLQWGLAAAAVLLLFISGFLLVQNARLRKQEAEARSQQATTAQRQQEIENQLNEQRSANAGLLKELEQLRESLPGSQSLKTVAFLLLPPTRGASQITKVTIPPGMDRVALRMRLETDGFPVYRAALKDLATNQTIWRSGDLKARSKGPMTQIAVTLAAGIFQPRSYAIEVSGVSSEGSQELLTTYTFKVMIE